MKKITFVLIVVFTLLSVLTVKAQEKEYIKRTRKITKELNEIIKNRGSRIKNITLSDGRKIKIYDNMYQDDRSDNFTIIISNKEIESDKEMKETIRIIINYDAKPKSYLLTVKDKDGKEVRAGIMGKKMYLEEGLTDYGLVLEMMEEKLEFINEIK